MHVFAVVCHKITNPLIYTVRKLSKSKNALVLILFDKKSADEEFIKLQKEFLGLENVEFVERISIDWAKFSLVEGPLLMMSYVENIDYKYFSLISGDDVAIPKGSDIMDFLDRSYEKHLEFIGFDFASKGLHGPYMRLIIDYPNYFYRRKLNPILKFRKKMSMKFRLRFLKKDISHIPPLYKGSNWFTLSKEAVSYILSYVRNNPKYVESFKKSFCSDEMFFHTILYNSDFKKNIYGSEGDKKVFSWSMRDIDWRSGPEFPRIYHEEDFENIKSRGMLFARKIDSNTPIDILEKYFP